MNAIPSLLTDHLDIWTSVETEKKSGRGRSGNGASVYGIQKLRELILELAVRGKLVSQDPNDEPAGELLKRIQAEKAKLIAEGKIKKDKSLPPISDEEKPFELPLGWEWARLADLVNILNGRAYKKEELLDAGTPVLRVGNLFTSEHWYYSDLNLEDEKYCNKGDLLFAWSASFGPFIWEGAKVIFHYHIWKLDLYGSDFIYKRYLYTFLLEQAQKIKASGHGVMMIHMTKEKMEKLIVFLPPIPEQHRIVAKVDELMALCDQLETQHINTAEAHEKLVSHLLGTLTQSQGTDDFNANWQRIAAHFDTLFTTEASIDALKQTLLQLAVMGKLVPQDLNDEPASELLKRIQAEKAALVAKGKIKKDKPLLPISDEEKPFELPKGWVWVRLSELASLITKGSSPKWQGVNYTDNPQDVMFVTSENVGSYSLLLDTPKYVEKKFNDIEPRSILVKGDFLMNIVGASIGRTAIYNIDTLANINQAVCLIRISSQNLLSMFLLHFFNSNTCLNYMFEKQVDNARPNLSMGNISKFLIPLPPIEEQHRIVTKVDELMTLCDQLISRITQASQLQKKLADGVVEQAIAS